MLDRSRIGIGKAWIVGAAAVLLLRPSLPGLFAESPVTPADVAALVEARSRIAVLAEARQREAKADVAKAKAAWWPQLYARGMYTTRDNPQEVAAGPVSFRFGQQSNGQYEIRARQLLWDGGRRGLLVAASKDRERAVRESSRGEIQQAQLEALSTYASVISLAQWDRVMQGRMDALGAHLSVVRDLYDNGLVARNDLLATSVRLREVKDARKAIQDRREILLRGLNLLLGSDPDTPLSIPDSLPPLPDIMVDLDSLTASATRSNAIVRAANAARDATSAAVRMSRRTLWPSIFAEGGHSWMENESFIHPHVNSFSVGVNWDIFDGGLRRAEIHRAEAMTTAAERDRVEAERSASIMVEETWRAWQQALREEETANLDVDAAVENLRIVEDQYRNGITRSSEVLDAEALLADSLSRRVDKENEVFMSQARLAVAAGMDLKDFYTGHGMTGEE